MRCGCSLNVDAENRNAAYMRLENARSSSERMSSNSMEAMHVMEGLMNMHMQVGGMLLGMLGSCAGC